MQVSKLAFMRRKTVIIFVQERLIVTPAQDTMDSVFPQFSTSDEMVLVSLPYRVGLYLSFSDTSGGFEAQEAEMQSLSNILREFAEDFCKSEFSQKVLMETLRQRAQWPSWSNAVENVPEEARHITDLLEIHFDDRALRAFKEVLVEIALAVAMAFHETSAEPMKPQLWPALGDTLAKFLGMGPKHYTLSHMNISKNERVALNRLCAAMHYEMK